MHKPFQKLLVGTCLLVLLAEPAVAGKVPIDLLRIQAGSSLELLDQNRYKEVWQEMSALFQTLGNQDQ